MSDVSSFSTCQILGIRFFNGDVDEAVALMFQRGGFLVAPSGTCFARLREDETYRRAVLAADLAIADSGLMVVLWRLLRRQNVQRISGFKYLKHLLEKPERRGKQRSVLGSSHRTRATKFVGLVAPGSFFNQQRRIVMSRRGTVRMSKIEIFLR